MHENDTPPRVPEKVEIQKFSSSAKDPKVPGFKQKFSAQNIPEPNNFSKDSGSEFRIDDNNELPDNSTQIIFQPNERKPDKKFENKPSDVFKPVVQEVLNINKFENSGKKDRTKVAYVEIPDDPPFVIKENPRPVKKNEQELEKSQKIEKKTFATEEKKIESSGQFLTDKKKGPSITEIPTEMISSDPKILKNENSQGKTYNSKVVEIKLEEDNEFEIKTVKSKPDLHEFQNDFKNEPKKQQNESKNIYKNYSKNEPKFEEKTSLKAEVDIEASIEDSSQLENAYMDDFIERRKAIDTKAKKVELNSSKGTIPENKDSRPSSKKSLEQGGAKVPSKVDTKSPKNPSFGKSESPRPEPLSPGALTSSTFMFDQPVKLMAENKVLNAISQQQRKLIIEDLVSVVRENFARAGKKLLQLEGEVSMTRLEKLYENYLIERNKFKYKTNEELLGFVLSLARTIPEPFLPLDLAKSKLPFTEMMIKEKLQSQYYYIFISIKELLLDSIQQN